MSVVPVSALSCDIGMHVGTTRELLLPRHVLHGDGAALALASELPGWGVPVGAAFVVADGYLVDAHVVDPVLDRFRAAGWKVEVFADVAGEPTVAVADQMVAAARAVWPQLVVGIGGGSAMDLAKVAALLCTNPGSVADHVGVDLPDAPAAPIILIPTTTGTGAEATRVAVLSDGDGKRIVSHRSLVPLGTALDADLVATLPPAITAATGMDALAHAIESCMSTASTPLTSSMSVRAAELLSRWLPVAYDEPDCRPARRGTLYGAFLAGVALNAGVVLGHSMAYTVANRTHLPHGVTCAMALPYCIAFNSTGVSPDVTALGGVLTGHPAAGLLNAAEAMQSLADRFGIPATPPAAGIPDDEAPAMADECGTTYHRPTNPVIMSPGNLEQLYAAWFAGDLHSAADIQGAAR